MEQNGHLSGKPRPNLECWSAKDKDYRKFFVAVSFGFLCYSTV